MSSLRFRKPGWMGKPKTPFPACPVLPASRLLPPPLMLSASFLQRKGRALVPRPGE